MESAVSGEICKRTTNYEDTDKPENSIGISLHAQTTARGTERLPLQQGHSDSPSVE